MFSVEGMKSFPAYWLNPRRKAADGLMSLYVSRISRSRRSAFTYSGKGAALISLKCIEGLELLYRLPKLGAQVISPRRESSRRLRILEVVGYQGLTLLRRVSETSRKVEVAEHPEPHRGVEELRPVEVGVLPIGYRLDVLLREEVLHAVVDLLVRQGLEVASEDLKTRHLEPVGLHVLDVVTPEGLLPRVIRLKSRRDDLPEDHARIDRGTDSAGVERPGEPGGVSDHRKTVGHHAVVLPPHGDLPVSLGVLLVRLAVGKPRVLDHWVRLDVLINQVLEVVLFVEPPVSSVEPRLRDAQPDIDLVLPLRKYPSVPGCRDVLVEVDETVFRSEVCLVLRPSVELQDVPSRRLDVIHIDLPLDVALDREEPPEN